MDAGSEAGQAVNPPSSTRFNVVTRIWSCAVNVTLLFMGDIFTDQFRVTFSLTDDTRLDYIRKLC